MRLEDINKIDINNDILDRYKFSTVINKKDLKIVDNSKKNSLRISQSSENEEKPLNRNYNFLFNIPEEKSVKIDNLAGKYCTYIAGGHNIKAIATSLRLIFIEKVKKFYFEKSITESCIEELTFTNSQERKNEILEALRNSPICEEVEENNETINITTCFEPLKFTTISKFFPQLDKDNDLEDIEERIHKCHSKSVEYSEILKNMEINNDVVTAYIHAITDKGKYVHSWVEFEIDGKKHVLDYTKNIVMNKEGYYSLWSIDEIISKINCVDIENDKKIYKQISNGYYHIDYKTYLTCRDEIMRDLQKNKEIFNEER